MNEINEPMEQPVNYNDVITAFPYSGASTSSLITPQAGCATCGSQGEPSDARSGGAGMTSYVYAIGKIMARFLNLSVEKEFAMKISQLDHDTRDTPDPQLFREVLSKHRYLARHMYWVLNIQGTDHYLLMPRDMADLDLLVEALRPDPSPNDIDLVIGTLGPIAPPHLCNGLNVRMVALDQIYSFEHDTFISSIPPKKEKTNLEQFRKAAAVVFNMIMGLTVNGGTTDEDRALNFVAMQYADIYAQAADELAREYSLKKVETRPSPSIGIRKMVDVIFTYNGRKNTDVTDKWFVRIDVAEEFPFLVTNLQQYIER